ncbi:LamG-like jellyroll fold domain-containing protein [Burkholderia pyrrocinia]|uniref:LamG-like jellyroll fold domain-containing protein n=1 Tax=Burkholderia pyrrocinia TaxID=60550 RepID=UPI001589B4BD|nr:LamG-like jellyroll fold domain-containing protein [Burkholderia pyrrocinia]
MDTTNKSGDGPAISRRSFLFSLSALALSACGGGGSASAASQDGAAASPVVGAGAAGGAAPASTPVGASLADGIVPASASAVATTVDGGTSDTAATPSNDVSNPAATSNAPATTTGAFIHPGLLHTQADFDRIALKVATRQQPWLSAWSVLIANHHASLSWTPRPQAEVDRGGTGPQNYTLLYNDIAAAYACALRWKVTGETAYADKSIQIMNAWSSTLKRLGGDTNVDLAAGIYGYEFANAGEIMRTYSGWAAADFAAFQSMMRNVFYPINHDFLNRHNNTDITHYWANWDLCNIASVMAIGVLCDDRALFDEAVNYFRSGAGNGAIAQAVYYLHPGHLGQWQETGRDQGHNTLGIALGGAICEMAWNQGIDLYGHDNNRFLAGAEYVAKANLLQPDGATYYTVPYVTYSNVDVTQTQFSTSARGVIRPCWALVYNHYVNRKGLAAPWSKQFALKIQPEGGGGNYGPNSGGYDQLGYGTLTCTRDAFTGTRAPSGLAAWVSASLVVLSWWGVASGTSYTVKRASRPGGPYTIVAAGIADPLTYTDSPAAGTWYYVVSARTPTGETGDSNEAVAVTEMRLHTRLPFDETSGSAVADASGNGHGGTLMGGATRAAGRTGNALSLDGVGGYVSLPDNLVADLSDFTIAAWVNWSGNGGKRWARVFDFGSGTARYMMLTPMGGTGVVRFAISTNGSHGERRVDGKAPLPTGRWAHVAVTLSGTMATLYVNGSVVGSADDVIFAPFRLGPTARNWIGRSQFAADPYFGGLIDEFRLYRNALDAEQIASLAQG